jgi:catalase
MIMNPHLFAGTSWIPLVNRLSGATALSQRLLASICYKTERKSAFRSIISVAALAFALLQPTVTVAQTTGSSTLAPGVRPVSPAEGTQITDPEQIAERTPGHLVQDMHAAFGFHHARAVHAKGFILQGSFEPSQEARTLSSSSVFASHIPVIVRFSDFTGLPAIPDPASLAQPRGLAVKFLLPDGSNYDVVNHSFNGFPVATSGEFGDLLDAIGASGPEAAKPTALDRYLDGHPIAKQFLTSQTPPPESWATTTYFGVNSMQFTNARQQSVFVRYRFVPEAGEHYLTAAAIAGKSPDYLRDEITKRVAAGPIRFTWYAQISGTGDAIENPAIAWPDSRKLVKLGVITIDKVAPNSTLADKSLLFLPGTTPPGIAVADPMLTVRNATYPVSFHERQ